MGLVLSAATGRGWTTGSGMEGHPVPVVGKDDDFGTGNISTFLWSLFTKSPRRRMLITFTCTICGQRITRAINPHADNDGTAFVQIQIIARFEQAGGVCLNQTSVPFMPRLISHHKIVFMIQGLSDLCSQEWRNSRRDPGPKTKYGRIEVVQNSLVAQC